MNTHLNSELRMDVSIARGRLRIVASRLLGSLLLLIALSARGQTALDTVVADFEKHLGDIKNAEATYIYRQQANDPNGGVNKSVNSFVGHWLYANGRELIDFRGDEEVLATLGQGDEAKGLREAVSQRVFLYDGRKNYTIFYNPLTQTAEVGKGRKVRGWPPSEFIERVTFPLGEKIVDLIKSNKTAKLITPSKGADDPIVIGFRHPRNDWAEYEISLLPSKGYRPVRIQISNLTAHRTRTYDIEPVLTNDVWFPAKVDYQDIHADGKGDIHVDWMCTKLSVNDPAFDATRLDPKLRKGTTVGDSIHGKTLVLRLDEDVRAFMKSLEK
jgi:hypothetical protein